MTRRCGSLLASAVLVPAYDEGAVEALQPELDLRSVIVRVRVDATSQVTLIAPLGEGGTEWTVERAFELFPRLAERRYHRGNQLSGGERGMLAVGRALMTDPQLILMDEPSEGLAPVMVQHLEGIIGSLKTMNLGILLVEQNLSVFLSARTAS